MTHDHEMVHPNSRRLANLSLQQEAMWTACETGNLHTLKTLFSEHYMNQGDDPLGAPDVARRAPDIIVLVACAIRNGQKHIVKYLLTSHFKVRVAKYSLVAAFFGRPNVKMVQLVYDRSPCKCDYRSCSKMDSFLADACLAGPKAAPLIHLLLDHGADPDEPGMIGGALRDGVEQEQPLHVLKRLVPHVSLLGWGLLAALKQERLDAIQLIVTHEYMRRRFDLWNKQWLLKEARSTGSHEVITMMTKLMTQLEAQSIALDGPSLHNEKLRTIETTMTEDCDSDFTGTEHHKTVLPAKSWSRKWRLLWK